MTPRSLFSIILKIFGLFFLREIVNTIPQLVSSLLYFTKSEGVGEGTFVFIGTLVILAFYSFVVHQLLFKTNVILEKLKLDQGYSQEEFTFNISTSMVLTIAIVVTGGVILINEIPNLCRHLFSYFQEKRLTQGMTKPDFSYSIISAVKIMIGLLLIGERKRIVEFVERRQKSSVDE
jgi:hypothetical protein